jgi:uncharacterized membrane protein
MADQHVKRASKPKGAAAPSGSEPVWTYKGYQLRPGEFTTAMVHLYRGEMQRANVWRQRLDATTNWAVLSVSASITWALSDPGHHHVVLILNVILLTLFLGIEARRYRYYELWAYRIRLLEIEFFAPMLVPPFGPSEEWGESLAETLLSPDFPISIWEAFGRRFRRNYIWIYLVLNLAWLLKVYLHPTPALSLAEYYDRVGFGLVPGNLLLLAGLIFNSVIFAIGLGTAGLRQSTSEVLPEIDGGPLLNRMWDSLGVHDDAHEPDTKATRLTFRRRKQLMALIVCAKPERVAEKIMIEMKRGATSLHGTGMYTHTDRDVLMVAISVTELGHLKKVVKMIEPEAFVVVIPAQEVLGRGFQPIE